MALGVAARMKAVAAGTPGAGAAPGAAPGPGPGGGPGGGRQGGGQADFQQVVNRTPPAALTDLQKGDAVMIVATQTENSAGVTAIMLVGGVEPILYGFAERGTRRNPFAMDYWRRRGRGRRSIVRHL